MKKPVALINIHNEVHFITNHNICLLVKNYNNDKYINTTALSIILLLLIM